MAAADRHRRRPPAGAVLSALVDLPLELAELHRTLAVGEQVRHRLPSDARVDAIVAAAGFERSGDLLTAQRALPDHVGAHLVLLCCGLNPSLHAADAGVGYVTANNRFWPALALAGLSSVDRDPVALLREDRIGMTDLVKRPTARASELSAAEFRDGLERLDELCRWLQPAAVVIVGLVGWRTAVDRRATVGWQLRALGPSPVYVMPSTSGLNAATSLSELAEHLRLAAAGPPEPRSHVPAGPAAS